MLRKHALCLMMLTLIAGPAMADTFKNGGFESGNFSGWTQGGGYWYGGWPLDPKTYLPGGSNYNASGITNTIMTGSGKDPITGLPTVYQGGSSARVNDSYNNDSVSVISQTVKNYTDKNIYFAWEATLQGSHGLTDSDNFTIQLTDDTTGKDIFNVAYSSASAAGTSLFSQAGDWYFTQWQVENLDVSQYMGDTFTLSLLASDCPYSGHAGYVYLDGFGAAPPPPGPGTSVTPEPSSLALLGTGVLGLGGTLRHRCRRARTAV